MKNQTPLEQMRSEYDNYAGDFYQEHLATGANPMTFEEFISSQCEKVIRQIFAVASSSNGWETKKQLRNKLDIISETAKFALHAPVTDESPVKCAVCKRVINAAEKSKAIADNNGYGETIWIHPACHPENQGVEPNT